MRVFIDGDVIKYRAGFAAEKRVYYLSYEKGPHVAMEDYQYKKDAMARVESLGLEDYTLEFRREPEPVENALHNVKTAISGIKDALQTDDILVCLSGDTNFRTEVATIQKYKGNRDDAEKPTHGPAIVDYIKATYPYVESNNEEADDVIGYMHYAIYKDNPDGTCIATNDKDLDMIPGLHYNFVREETYSIGDFESLYNFYMQVLMGDSTDNIRGVPNVGKVRARETLEGLKTEEELCAKVRMRYGNDPAFLETGQLIWIRRHPEEMWLPVHMREQECLEEREKQEGELVKLKKGT